MGEGGDLPLGRQARQRLLLQDAGVAREVIADALVHDEEAAVDESGLFFGLFSKGAHVLARDFEVPNRLPGCTAVSVTIFLCRW